MKAVLCSGYGSPEVLRIREIPKPVPKDNEILVRIIATTVNSGDVRIRGLAVEGFMKIIMRLIFGISKPKNPILGTVFSGKIENIGKKVTKFKIGDEVFGTTGFKFGTYAEYIAVHENSNIILKPRNASFEEAAALPFGGQTALYFLEKAKINENIHPKILIIGATGSVGTAAIQIAKSCNAEITSVCSSDGFELVKSLGVMNIILYDKEDLFKDPKEFDIVFDAVGKTSRKQCKRLMKKGGVYKTVGGLEYAAETKRQLKLLSKLFDQKKYKAVIDKIFSIDKVVDAHKYVDTGRKKGNVVLKISE